MNIFFKIRTAVIFLFISLFLCSCQNNDETDSNKKNDIAIQSKATDDSLDQETIDNYRKKVRKRVSKSVNSSIIRELGKYGVSESQVKCLLKDASYITLATEKNTPEVQAIFKKCGVDAANLENWGR